MLDYLGFPDSQDDVNKLLKIVDPAAVVMLVMYVGPSGSNLQKGRLPCRTEMVMAAYPLMSSFTMSES